MLVLSQLDTYIHQAYVFQVRSHLFQDWIPIDGKLFFQIWTIDYKSDLKPCIYVIKLWSSSPTVGSCYVYESNVNFKDNIIKNKIFPQPRNLLHKGNR
jgi:hypothetical protein